MKTPKPILYGAFVCLAACLVGTAGYAVAYRKVPPATSAPLKPGAFFPTEQLWIVKDVSAAIANMAAYAPGAHPTAMPLLVHQVLRSKGELARFELKAGNSAAPIAVRITDHIWAPASYAPVVSALVGRGTPCPATTPSPAIAALLQPTRDVIQRENLRVSTRLRDNMRCADAHAEAALIVGVLALREAATSFSDPRRLISRMTAHMSMADGLGVAPTSPIRQLSEIVLLTLIGRQQSALDRVDALERQEPTAAFHSWGRALRLRNTGDWRLLADPNQATLLEQIELIRAADYSLGDPRTLDFIDAIRHPADIPDWGRIVMNGSPGVEAGNRFAASAVVNEIREASEARATYFPGDAEPGPEALVNALKVEPTDGPVGADGTVWVVDWPMWAAIAERHLITTLNARDTHLSNVINVQDAASEFRKQVVQTFSGLRLYPLLAITLAPTRQEARPGMAASLVLLQTHPELVTHWMWKSVLMKETWAALPTRIPRLESWFTPPFPAGTVFEPNTRSWNASLVAQFTAAEIAPYRRAAPYSRALPFVTIGPDYEKAPAAVLKKEFGTMTEYNLRFAVMVADALKDSPDAYVTAIEAAAKMSPEHLQDLAEYLVDCGRLDQARTAYERWFAAGRNEVAIGAGSEWMVRDYFDRGQRDRANALADRSADTYSSQGLLTRAHLYDWQGDAAAAERFYRAEAERYDDPGPLLGFLLRRHRAGTEFDALKWSVFPGGIVPVSLPSLREAPAAGVEVASVGHLGERLGLRTHDIIVAVDGVRVNNRAQYYSAKAMSLNPIMRVTIWRELKYSEVTAPLRYGGQWGSVDNYPGTRKPLPVQPRRWR